MARLHVLDDWHGPGEERAARSLATALPESWDVVAGRQIPTPMGSVDLDLIVVGPCGVHVCEEKAWGPRVLVGEVTWHVNGKQRPNPANQVLHGARVLAGRFRDKVAGWAVAKKQAPRGTTPVSGHVVLSHEALNLAGARELGRDVVLQLEEAPAALVALDAVLPDDFVELRPRIMAYLLGLAARSEQDEPNEIMQYSVLGKLGTQGNATVYATLNPAGQTVFLYCVPTANTSDAGQAKLLAVREHDALAALAAQQRTWTVQGWFDWDGYRVTPVIPALDGTSLHKLAVEQKDVSSSDRRVSAEVAAPIVRDSLTALATVHEQGIQHRALQPRSIELSVTGRVRFLHFARARIADTSTISPWLDDDDVAAPFRAPDTNLATFRDGDDVYSLALSLTQWLHGDLAETPDHDLARQRAAAYPLVGKVLERCLAIEYDERPRAAAAAAELDKHDRGAKEEAIAAGILLHDKYRIVSKLGEGSFAFTWLAWDEEADRNLTLKHMRAGRITYEQAKVEFHHASQLRSPNCAQVYDLRKWPEPGVLIQEYVPGESLHDLASRGCDEPDRLRRIAVDVLRGLAHAHDEGLLHRDVSPKNIIVRPDGRALLIDFGLASPIDQAQTAVGTPAFTAPEVWTHHRWTPQADIYSAAASLLWAMLGRYPYVGPGIEQRSELVSPTVEEEERLGKSLLAVLYQGIATDPAKRPESATEFADQVQRVRDTDAVSGRPLVNPTVDALRGLYRASRIGNAGNRGLDDPFAQETYAPTLLDTSLLPAIFAGNLDVVVLTGNPGDGKTSFLVRVGEALDRDGAETAHQDAAGWTKRLDGRTFVAVYDASESHGDLSSDDLLRQALDPQAEDDPERRTVLLAANDGRVTQFFTDHEDRYPDVAEDLRRQRNGKEPRNSRIALVDLKRRALTAAEIGGPSLGRNVLQLFTDLPRWRVCHGCVARQVCPIRANAEHLRTDAGQSAVGELLLTSHLRRRRRATVRDLRSALAWLITGDLSCQEVHAEHEQSYDPAAAPRRQVHDLAFAADTGDYLVQEWSELDPAELPAPGAVRAARARPHLVPDLTVVGPETMAKLKRELFLGMWSLPHGREEVRSYRYLDEYLAAFDDSARILARILLGLSRVLSTAGYDGSQLALRDGRYEDEAVRGIVVVKELARQEFTLTAVGGAMPYIESFADHLLLRHTSGARLRITLDTAELLLRAADGEILGDSASAAVRQEVVGFGDRLQRQPARSVRIMDGSGRSVTAVVREGRIVREMA